MYCPSSAFSIKHHTRVLNLSKPVVMGILNVTPDSFSDGGHFNKHHKAMDHALSMIEAGAAIIDVGGESTRPGATPITLQEEMDRVLPVVESVRKRCPDIWISVDTSNAGLMEEAVGLGANLINDVRALTRPGALDVVAKLQVPVCIMHMQGQPSTMQDKPAYDDVLQEVHQYLAQRISVLIEAGIALDHIIVDPGVGFGKSLPHNLTLLAHLNHFADLQCPILIGVSRKSMFGALTGASVDQRLPASLAAALWSVHQGAHIVRVHDVAETVQAIQVQQAILEATTPVDAHSKDTFEVI